MDKELEAMQAVYAALGDLDSAARERVLSWAAGKFEIESPAGKRMGASGGSSGAGEDAREYAHIGDLFDAAQPNDGPARALVAGYFFQEIEGRDGWGGGEVNNALKNLGHP